MTILTLDKKKSDSLLFFMCCFAYASSYFGRYNFSAAIAAIVSEGLFTKTQMGAVGTIFFIVYGTGQLINGFLGDRFSPLKMIFCGCFVSSLANLSMACSSTLSMLCISWGINGFAQSMLWSPMIYIISNVLDVGMRKKVSMRIALTIPTGTISAYLSSTLLMRFFRWNSVFVAGSCVLMICSLLWLAMSLKIGSIYSFGRNAAAKVDSSSSVEGRKKLLPLLLSAGVFIMAVPILLHSMLKDGVMTWVPTMLSETYGLSPSFSTLLSVVLPVINLGGALIATKLCFEKGLSEMRAALCFFVFSLLPLTALLFIGRLPAVVGVAMLALITMSMYGINHVFLTLVPVTFAKHGRASTMAGMIDAMAYLGSALSTYGFGRLSESFGWGKTVFAWVIIVAVALVACALGVRRWEKFKKLD